MKVNVSLRAFQYTCQAPVMWYPHPHCITVTSQSFLWWMNLLVIYIRWWHWLWLYFPFILLVTFSLALTFVSTFSLAFSLASFINLSTFSTCKGSPWNISVHGISNTPYSRSLLYLQVPVTLQVIELLCKNDCNVVDCVLNKWPTITPSCFIATAKGLCPL